MMCHDIVDDESVDDPRPVAQRPPGAVRLHYFFTLSAGDIEDAVAPKEALQAPKRGTKHTNSPELPDEVQAVVQQIVL